MMMTKIIPVLDAVSPKQDRIAERVSRLRAKETPNAITAPTEAASVTVKMPE